MIIFEFSLKEQFINYKEVKNKLKTNFYQDLRFYVLPFMPEKFRNRVVFLPEKCEPEKTYRRKRNKIEKLELDWKKNKSLFIKKIKKHFRNLDEIKIVISPSLYGTVGSYILNENTIIIKPRYDRNIFSIKRLIVNALTHYFFFDKNNDMNKLSDIWIDKQNKTELITKLIFGPIKSKSMIKVLDTEFAGKLAEESHKYLERLNANSKKQIEKPKNLTRNENEIFNLLLRNKNKLVSFEEISEWLWKDKSVEKYSEYAITKLIERLKKKLPKNLIHSQRGTGYILHI